MGNSASSLPFSIDNQVGAPHDHNGWALHNGKSTDGNQTAVSVFVGKKPLLAKQAVSPRFPNQMQLLPALHHYNMCRKLRHPQILKVYATLDTDNPTAASQEGAATTTSSTAESNSKTTTGDLIVVTEPCMPLSQWLLSPPTPEQLAWGLECLIRGLHFLHHSAKLAHGNMSPTSFYVTQSGDVKLWNFSLVTPIGANGLGPTPHFQQWEMACTPDAYRSPERVERRWDAVSTVGVHAMDSYGLGILMDHWFSGGSGGGSMIPLPLQKAVQRLLTPNLKMRPRLQPLLKCPVFDTPYQKLQLQLEEITVQPVEQKVRLWQDLGTSLQNGHIPQDVALYKILPLVKASIQTICNNESMLTQDLYRREVLSMLQPLFFILESYLDASQIGKELSPLISPLFLVKDRGVRGALLNKVGFMSQHLEKNKLNASVFEPLCSGFNDSSAALRELTLKATFGLVPFLNAPNLEKLSRYLVRLQSDSETSIRTNAVIFVAKLAPHLSEVSMQKMLLPAYARAMKDPFLPCRLAGVQSTLNTKELFTMNDIATKVLPCVMPLLLDPMPNVRQEAFHVVNTFLISLKQESDRMETIAQQQQQQQQAAGGGGGAPSANGATTAAGKVTAPTPAPASGSYLRGLSSWMASSAKPETGAMAPSPSSGPPQPQPPRAAAVAAPVPHYNAAAPPVRQFAATSLAAPPPAGNDGWGDEEEEDDGWGDEDDGGNDLGMSNIGKNTTPIANTNSLLSSTPFSTPNQFDEDDDPFASIGMKTMTSTVVRPRGKLILPKKKPGSTITLKPKAAAAPATKLKMDDDEIVDGWDDF